MLGTTTSQLLENVADWQEFIAVCSSPECEMETAALLSFMNTEQLVQYLPAWMTKSLQEGPFRHMFTAVTVSNLSPGANLTSGHESRLARLKSALSDDKRRLIVRFLKEHQKETRTTDEEVSQMIQGALEFWD